MRFSWKLATVVVAAVACLAGASLAAARTSRGGDGPAPTPPAAPPDLAAAAKPNKSGCQLGGPDGNGIKHVTYLQFDNVHYNRDNPDVASDLEQMPHLLKFLTDNGTLLTNDHTILISHTAGGILSSLTGLYPDRQGQTVSNAYQFYDGSKNPHNSSSFKYWTAPVDPALDPLPNMITDGQKTTPAPWVPFTRAGCDVGGVGTANIELENTGTTATGDITKVFGMGSPEWNEASTDSQAAQTDFVGIAIHCSQAPSSVCDNNSNAHPDPLPDEPGGYTGYNALYGAKYVDPAITGGKQCVPDTSGESISDPVGRCGFPGFDGMLAKNTLGYVAAMQEAGVPVTYGYISDVHDLHVPTLSTDSYSSSATGPGEKTHLQQLHDYDMAFKSFFEDLQQHGISKDNTLFVITVDEGDHFAGGIGNPQPDGQVLSATAPASDNGDDNGAAADTQDTTTQNLIYDHRTCTNLMTCPTNQLGEIGANMYSLTGQSNYQIHFDDAPAFYVNGQPAATDPGVRSTRADGGRSDLDRPVRPAEQRPADGEPHGGNGRSGGAEDVAHDQHRPQPDADLRRFRQPGLLLPDVRPVRERRARVRRAGLRLEPR